MLLLNYQSLFFQSLSLFIKLITNIYNKIFKIDFEHKLIYCFLFSLSFAQYSTHNYNSIEADSFPYLIINFDETGHNDIYLDIYVPRYYSDMDIGSLIIDGSISVPGGTYKMPQYSDLTRYNNENNLSKSQINYIQGDYNYKEVGVGMQSYNSDSSLISLQGLARNVPQLPYRIIKDGNTLQNYLFNFNNSQTKFDILVHRESSMLPVDSLITFSREVESYHTGLEYKYSISKFNFYCHAAFQYTKLSVFNQDHSTLTNWLDFNSSYTLSNNLNFSLSIDSKDIYFQNDTIKYISSYIIRNKLHHNSKTTQMNIGFAYQNKLIPEWEFKYNNNSINLSFFKFLNRDVGNNFNSVSEFKLYEISGVSFGNGTRIYNNYLEIFKCYSDAFNYWGIIGKNKISLYDLNFSISFTNYFTNDLPIKSYIETKYSYIPKKSIWRNKRYKPYISLESTFVNFTGKYEFRKIMMPSIQESNINNYSSLLANLEVGLKVKDFSVSYHWINLPREIVKNSRDYYSISNINYFKVIWIFND